MLGGRGSAQLAARGFDYPFSATSPILKKADLAIANLEAPLTRRGNEYAGKQFRFRAEPPVAAALQRAGVSAVTLANNHMLDFGTAGLEDTLQHLSAAKLAFVGAGRRLAEARRPAVITVKGKKVGLLAYSLTLPDDFFATPFRAGTAPGYLGHVRADVKELRGQVDYVVVSFHWGGELMTSPRPYQTVVARAAIDAGADIVIGHHPHVLQGIERYKNGLILYSLGNYVFATPSSRSDRSIIAVMTLDGSVREVELFPLNVLNREVRLQPALLDRKRARQVIDHLNRLSVGMGTTIINEGSRYLIRFAPPATIAAR